MRYNNAHKSETLRERLKSWTIGRGMQLQEPTTVSVMINELLEDIEEIPEIHVSDCWASAKRNSQYMPRGCDLLKAWREDVSKRPANATGYLSPPKKHECIYCSVVALRLGVTPPDSTDWEKEHAKKPVTERELACVKAYMKGIELDFWNSSDKSPYSGMLK